MPDFQGLAQNVVAGRAAKVKEIVNEMVGAGVKPLDIINLGLIAGMDIVGPRFKKGEMFVPEVLMSAKAMASGIEIVKPLMTDSDVPSIGKVVIGTVKGDLHDIGKNLVAMMLESSGFVVINAGVDVAPEKFIELVKEHNVDFLGMSALLTTTMMGMKDTIELLKEEGLRDKVKVLIGGAPVSQDFADRIGADGFAADAATAVEMCKNLFAAV